MCRSKDQHQTSHIECIQTTTKWLLLQQIWYLNPTPGGMAALPAWLGNLYTHLWLTQIRGNKENKRNHKNREITWRSGNAIIQLLDLVRSTFLLEDGKCCSHVNVNPLRGLGAIRLSGDTSLLVRADISPATWVFDQLLFWGWIYHI